MANDIDWCVSPVLLSLPVEVGKIISDDPRLLSGCCCKPNRPSGGTILVGFGGNPFINMSCESDSGNWILIQHEMSTPLEYDEFIAGSSKLLRNNDLISPFRWWWTVVIHYTFTSWNPAEYNKHSSHPTCLSMFYNQSQKLRSWIDAHLLTVSWL